MKRPFTTRSAPGFGLAFLDVLCCGLGSAVLLLLIVKHGPADAGTIDQATIDARTRDVQERIAAEESHREGLLERLAEQERILARDAAALETLSSQQQAQAARYAGLLDQLRSERATLRENAASLQALQSAVKQPEEPESRPYGKQLTGINVADDRVAIFLDRSASMLHPSLVEIVRLRVSSPELKRSARKWAAAREAARWAYRQLPDGTRFQFFTYAGDLKDIAGATPPTRQRISWQVKGSPGADANALDAALAGALPDGPTNLKQVFETAARLVPRPRQLLILTDGYPTVPGNRRLSGLRGCPTPRKGATPVLSPRCREAVYLDAVEVVNKRLAGVPVDVILFPLEGDANAVRGYWLLSALSGGRMLTPARGWPYP
ncbi:MAG: hypothetical protein OXP09_18610 [Gammaproteobacteria bacterium]|nr:hypothetical protein [Gammaproteobacteria bacterium]